MIPAPEKIRKIDKMPMIGRTIGAENFVRKRPDKLSAAIASVHGVIFSNNRHALQTPAMKKNAAAMSDATSALCASIVGSKAAMVSASKPPIVPKNSRAQR